MRCHTSNIIFWSVLFANVIYAEHTVCYVIFAWHDSAVVDIPKHGQCNRACLELT